MLKSLKIQHCAITELWDYSGGPFMRILSPTITEQEYSEYIEEQREQGPSSGLTDDELRDNLLEEKKIQAILEAREEIMDTLLSKCRFSLDKKEVAAYSQNIVHNYESQAMLYDMELEQYREDILGYTKKEFYEVCYEEGEEEIKTYLVIGAIAWKEFPEKASDWEKQDIYSVYQQLENAVYSYFIQTDKDF